MTFPCARCKKQCSVEFLGTFLLVLAGPSMVAFTALTSFPYYLFAIATTFGGVVGFVILVFGKISGAHINPAVTVAQTLAGRLKKDLLVPYVVFQLVGGLAAGLMLRLIFPASESSIYLGSTVLASGISPLAGFVLEVIGTFALVFVILQSSSPTLALKFQALMVGGTLFILILAIGPLTGAGLNPARSIGPAVAAGYLENLQNYILGPILGASLATVTRRRIMGR